MTDLKRSCDACVTSKVKCSGSQPCTRCDTRKIDCFYRARKKRAPPTAAAAAASPAAARQQDHSQHKHTKTQLDDIKDQALDLLRQTAPQYLPAHEKLSWLVFFTLYKNYRAGCSRLWFERQLARLSQRLQQEQKPELYKVFQLWTKSLNVDFPDKIQQRFLGCMKALSDKTSAASALACQGSVHFHVPGTVCPTLPSEISPNNVQVATNLEDMKRVFLNNFDQVAHMRMRCVGAYPNDGVEVDVNDRFTEQFGVNIKQIRQGCVMGSGLLPWGGDMLCWIVPSEADVFAFMQVCALNFTWGVLKSFPCVRVVPSTHILSVRLKSGQVVPCLLKCIHRESIDLDSGTGMELIMSFEPVMPTETSGSNSVSSSVSGFDAYLPVADGDVVGEAAFPDFNLETVENDADFLQDLLDFARQDDL